MLVILFREPVFGGLPHLPTFCEDGFVMLLLLICESTFELLISPLS